ISTSSSEVPREALTEITAARMGPAQGAYTKPNAAPTTIPDQNPVPAERGPKRARRDSGASRRAASAGTISDTPNPSSTRIASVRRKPPASPTPWTTEATPTTVRVNVVTSPTTTPSGRRRPPVAPAESSAGRTGRTHGDIAVPAPATSANPTRMITRHSVPARREALQRVTALPRNVRGTRATKRRQWPSRPTAQAARNGPGAPVASDWRGAANDL